MATETMDRRASHLRSLTVTALASLAGVTAGLLSSTVATGATDEVIVAVLGAFVLVQFPLLRVLGVDVEEFSKKDYLYVGFMTFALWFVTLTILFTEGTTLAL